MSEPAESAVDGVRNFLSLLDGSEITAVSLLTGLSADEIQDLGGVP